jgi:hypothetical protein
MGEIVTIELGDGRKIGAMRQIYFDHLKMRGEVRFLGFDGCYYYIDRGIISINEEMVRCNTQDLL